MFALRPRTTLVCARGPLGEIASLARPSATRTAAFSTTPYRRAAEVAAVEEEVEESGINDGARIPLSIQANYYEPLRRQPTHGLPVCDLQLRSYSVRNLEFMCDFALRAAYYANLPVAGPVPMPRKIERWTVPKGNFVHKKSQENFERVTHKRLIQVRDGHPETVELWLAFLKKHQYYGVGMKANIFGWDKIGVGKEMKVSLETLRDVEKPKWAHFGPRKTVDTAEKARQILNSAEYKALEKEPETLPKEKAAGSPEKKVQAASPKKTEAAASPAPAEKAKKE